MANGASKYRRQSLNRKLLTGPDHLNSLLGILLRFREHPVAILADFESMFMQIAVKKEDQSALCFLWSKNYFIMQYQSHVWFLGQLDRLQWPSLSFINVLKINFSQSFCSKNKTILPGRIRSFAAQYHWSERHCIASKSKSASNEGDSNWTNFYLIVLKCWNELHVKT